MLAKELMASNGVQKLMELLLGVTQEITRAAHDDDERLVTLKKKP